MESARLLQRELQYQADHIVDAIDRGSADVVGAVQRACDYLGGELCEVRWAIERQSQISREILQVLLTALDNASRQYWEQGVKCWETAEYDIAKERFNRALDSNRTNYFAYQYLGFIAVHDENSQEVLKNFDLARKFAENGYYRALALSYLARGHHAKGDLPQALQSSVAATQAAPDQAKFWYETAVYYVRDSAAEEAIRCLRQAISIDWMYWSISISDANLDPIRNRAERLLAEMREEQRVVARQRLDHFGKTIETLHGMNLVTEIEESGKRFEQCETSYKTGTVFAYRDLVQPTLDGDKRALESADKALDRRISALRDSSSKAQADHQREIAQASARIRDLESQARSVEQSTSSSGCLKVGGGLGCVVFLLCYALATSAPSVEARTWEHIFLIAVVACLAAVLWGPVNRYFTATSPARSLRSEIPGLTAELERATANSASRLAKEQARIAIEIDKQQRHKEYCQSAIRSL